MWSALADGFSEFATVVSQDAKNVMDSVSTKTSRFVEDLSRQDEKDLLALQQEGRGTTTQQNNDDDNDDNNNNNSSSPTRFLSRISQSEFSQSIPGYTPESRKNRAAIMQQWKEHVLALQQEVELTFLDELEDSDRALFTPVWLLSSSSSSSPQSDATENKRDNDDQKTDENSTKENSSNHNVDRDQLFSTGLLLVQNSEIIRSVFLELFPEAGSLTMDNLERNVSQKPEDYKVIPSEFFLRYFTRLNKLYFLMKKDELSLLESREHSTVANDDQNQHASKRTKSSSDEANTTELNEKLASIMDDNKKLLDTVKDQQETIRAQESMLREYKDKTSELVLEKDRLKLENSEQEQMIRQLKLDLERLKLTNAQQAQQLAVAVAQNSSVTNNNTNAASGSSSSSNVTAGTSTPVMAGASSGDLSNHVNSNNDQQQQAQENRTFATKTTKDNNADDDDEEEGWTEIS